RFDRPVGAWFSGWPSPGALPRALDRAAPSERRSVRSRHRLVCKGDNGMRRAPERHVRSKRPCRSSRGESERCPNKSRAVFGKCRATFAIGRATCARFRTVSGRFRAVLVIGRATCGKNRWIAREVARLATHSARLLEDSARLFPSAARLAGKV